MDVLKGKRFEREVLLPGERVVKRSAGMRRRRAAPLPVAYAVLGCFILAERLLRQGPAAASLDAGPSDQGTTRAVGRAFGWSLLAVVVAPVLNRWRLGAITAPRLAWSGVAAMAAGLTLRIWAARVLGAYYTRTLRTSAAQTVVDTGPYRVVRHPGYLGVLLLWLGAALASANIVVASCITLWIGRAYHERIRSEEALLAATFGAEYAAYVRHTWRLIPWVY